MTFEKAEPSISLGHINMHLYYGIFVIFYEFYACLGYIIR